MGLKRWTAHRITRDILKISILAALVLETSVVHADCDTAIDLRRNGTVMNLPSGDQGDSYLCGFFSASTLLDSFRIRERAFDSLPIDPVALAIDLAIERNAPRWLPFQITADPLRTNGGPRGSFFCSIVRHVRENGICDHRDPRALDREWLGKRSNQALALYSVLDGYADLNNKDQRTRLSTLLAAVKPLIQNEPSAPGTTEDLIRILWENRNHPYRAVRALLYPSCAERRAGRAFEYLPGCSPEWFVGLGTIGIGSDQNRASRLEYSIHDGLEQRNALPVPVVQCYQVFREGRAYRRSNPFGSECILHYTTVVGRRKKNGVCQFLVRNSYDPKDEDAIAKDWERDGNDFWLDADLFSRSALGLHWLEE